MKRLSFYFLIAVLTFTTGVSVNIIWLAKQVPLVKPQTNHSSEFTFHQTEEIKASPGDLALIRDYAERFEPMPPHNMKYDNFYMDENGKNVAMLPVLPKKVSEALESIYFVRSKEDEKYIVLIVLRLYRYHIEVNKQPYDIRAQSNEPAGDVYNNAIAREFCRLTGIQFYQNDLVLSDEAYRWVQMNPTLLKYQPIKEEMRRIERAKINNHLEELREKERNYRDWVRDGRPPILLN